MQSCLSVAFFNTSAYTRFFSAAEALRMKSENGVDLTVFSFENIDILFNLDYTDQFLKVSRSIFFWYVVVNLVNSRFIQLMTVIVIF